MAGCVVWSGEAWLGVWCDQERHGWVCGVIRRGMAGCGVIRRCMAGCVV